MSSLQRRITLWSCMAAFAGLLVFAVAVYVQIVLEESDEAEEGVPDDPAEVYSEAREEVLVALAMAAPVALGLVVLASRYASRRALAPINRAIDTATAISIDRFDRRMELPEAGHELRPLAQAVNDLLDRLQRGYLALAEFSADASHELRTPLAAVSNELEVALRRPRTVQDWEGSARTSLAELRRLSAVVDAMLRFAQADAIRDADAEDVDLAELVDDAVSTCSTASARRVTIAIDASEPPPHGHVHAELLATAVANIVGNAVRMTPDGGEVRVRVERVEREIAIHVDDTGPGLPAETRELFVPFSRLAGPSGGIGLGLAITKRIVERHGGTVTASDRPSGGARFSILLPHAIDRPVRSPPG